MQISSAISQLRTTDLAESIRFYTTKVGLTLEFKYQEVFGGEPPEAYERLLLDAIHGDPTLYSRGDWIEQAWRLTQPILDHWARSPGPLPEYEAGSWGPADAEAFIARDGGTWRRP